MASDKEEILLKLKIEENRALKKLKEVKESVNNLDRRTTKYKNTVREQVALESKLISIRKQRVVANKQMEGSVERLTKAQVKGKTATGASTSAALELGRVISDAPYGIRGMANNVSQLASQFSFMSNKVDETTGKVVGFQGALKNIGKAVKANAALLVIQAIIAAADYLSTSVSKADKALISLAESGVNESITELTLLKNALEDSATPLEKKQELIKGAREEYEDFNDAIKDTPTDIAAALSALDLLIIKYKDFAKAKALTDLVSEAMKDQAKAVVKYKGDWTDMFVSFEQFFSSIGSAVSGGGLNIGSQMRADFGEAGEALKKYEEMLNQPTKSDPTKTYLELIYGSKNKGKGKGKVKEKKLSPFKTPKELDIDIKNAENAIIQYEKKIEDARLKEEFNEKMSTAKTEEEKEKIRRTYQKDRLLNQIKAEKLALELKKKTEIENVKLKTSNHKADLKRIYDKYIFELSLNKKLSDEEKKKLKDEATGKFGIANIQATGEENISIQEITDKYTPLFSLFQKLSDARLSALFSTPSKKGKKDDKASEYDLEAGLNSYMELQQGLTNFMDGEFSRQITLEQNKTNAINNELRERLNNENLSAGERKNIQLQIARNDEALRKKQEKIEKKRFRMQKAANISQALIETYLAAAKALKTFGGVPTGLPAMSATIATGLLNVATIARQKFQSSAGATVPAGALGSGGSGGADRSFNFNLAGASQENQLAQTLQSQFDQPIQTYVVARDITNQQQLDQDILSNASFG